jgi:DNA invertase Pin-like site-specific DNA recombinase
MNNVAYSYIRCSTREQLKGDSIRRQLKQAEDYASKHNLILSKKGYKDLGMSAYHEKNLKEGSEFMALIKAIEKRRIPKGSTLIIENLDRLSRGFITNSLPLFMRIINSGVRIATVTDDRCYDHASVNKNPMDLMMAVMILSAANAESKKKNERVAHAWKEAQKNAETKKIRTSFPGWLALHENKFTEKREEVKLVCHIFKMFLGGIAVTKIARTLNEEGVKTLSGKTWVATTVKYLLKNPAVIGEYHAGRRENGRKVKTGQVVKGYYPEIISSSDYHRAQAKFILNPAKVGRPQPEEANLFAGIIKCPYCGGSMGINNARKSGSFICWNSINGGCIRAATPAQFVERAVFTSTGEITESMSVTEVDEAKIEALEGEIAQIKKKVTNLVQLVADGSEIAEVSTKIRELKSTQLKKEEELRREHALDQFKKREAEISVVRLIGGDFRDKKTRLAIIPHIRRHIAKVEVYFVGDKFNEYKKRHRALSLRGDNGGAIFHRLRKEFNLDLIQYVKVYFNYPIVVSGKQTDVWTCRRTIGGFPS